MGLLESFLCLYSVFFIVVASGWKHTYLISNHDVTTYSASMFSKQACAHSSKFTRRYYSTNLVRLYGNSAESVVVREIPAFENIVNFATYAIDFDRAISALDVQRLRVTIRPETQAFTMVALAHIAHIQYNISSDQFPVHFHLLLQPESLYDIFQINSTKKILPEVKQAIELAHKYVPWLQRLDDQRNMHLLNYRASELSAQEQESFAYLDLLLGYCHYYGLGRIQRNVSEARRLWQHAGGSLANLEIQPEKIDLSHINFLLNSSYIRNSNDDISGRKKRRTTLQKKIDESVCYCPAALRALAFSHFADVDYSQGPEEMPKYHITISALYKAAVKHRHVSSLSLLLRVLLDTQRRHSPDPTATISSSASDQNNSANKGLSKKSKRSDRSIQNDNSSKITKTKSSDLFFSDPQVPTPQMYRLARLAAEAGDASAQILLGRLLRNLRRHWSSASSQSFDSSQQNLTLLLDLSQSFVTNEANINNAATANTGLFPTGASINMTLLLDQFSHELMFWYTRAAEQGLPAAMSFLGLAYFRGVDGCEVDLSKAYYWLKQATSRGIAWAWCQLGILYEQGVVTKALALQAMAQTPDGRGFSHNFGLFSQPFPSNNPSSDTAENSNNKNKGANNPRFTSDELICRQHKLSLVDIDHYLLSNQELLTPTKRQAIDFCVKRYEREMQHDYAQAVDCYRHAALSQQSALGWLFLSTCYARGVGIPQSAHQSLQALHQITQLTTAMANNAAGNTGDPSTNRDTRIVALCRLGMYHEHGWSYFLLQDAMIQRRHPDPRSEIFNKLREIVKTQQYSTASSFTGQISEQDVLSLSTSSSRKKQKEKELNKRKSTSNKNGFSNDNRKKGFSNSSENDDLTQVSDASSVEEEQGLLARDFPSPDDELAFSYYSLAAYASGVPSLYRGFARMSVGRMLERGRVSLQTMQTLQSINTATTTTMNDNNNPSNKNIKNAGRGDNNSDVQEVIPSNKNRKKSYGDKSLSSTASNSEGDVEADNTKNIQVQTAVDIRAQASREAIRLYEIAAKEDGSAEAAYEYAQCLETGKGQMQKNLKEAMKWYEFAAKQGKFPLAKVKLQALAKQLVQQQMMKGKKST